MNGKLQPDSNVLRIHGSKKEATPPWCHSHGKYGHEPPDIGLTRIRKHLERNCHTQRAVNTFHVNCTCAMASLNLDLHLKILNGVVVEHHRIIGCVARPLLDFSEKGHQQGTSKPLPGVVDLFHVPRQWLNLSSWKVCFLLQNTVHS